MIVRAATTADAAGIASVRVRGWQSAYRGMFADDYLDAMSVEDETPNTVDWIATSHERNAHVRVAVIDDAVVGFVASGPPRQDDAVPTDWEVYAIYADPTRLGQGIGRALMQAAVATVPADRPDVLVWVLDANTDARAFYERLGFADDGARDEIDDHRTAGEPLTHLRYRAKMTDLREALV